MRTKLLIALLFIGLVSATTVTLNESNLRNVGDSYVAQGSAGSNYGTATSMQVVSYTSANQRMFILWNLTLPAGITVTSAKLAIYMNTAPSAGRTYNAYNTSNAWTETGITWTNQPSAGTLQQGISTGTTNGVWLVWDVTNAVISSIAQSNQNMSIVIIDSSENSGTSYTGNFYARDDASATYRPQLNVTYTPASNEPATGLVGYWRFDENTGTMTDDSSGNGNIGTLVNSPTWTTGKNYQTPYALNFASDSYVNAGNSSVLNPSGNYTLSAWIRRTGTEAYPISTYGIVTKGAVQYGVWLYGSTLYVMNGTVGINVGNGDTILPLNTWTHLTLTFNGSSMILYVNGVSYWTGTGSSVSSGTGNVQIGYINQYMFNGTIDEVKIWNRTLSDAEVLNETFHYCPLNPINIFPYNESSTSQFIASNLVASNSTSTFSLLIQSLFMPDGIQSYTGYYCNSSFPIGATTISISNSSFYSPRYYYSTLTYGGSYGLNTYLLPLTDTYPITTSFIIISGSLTVTTATVTVQKLIGSTWTTMAQKQVDSTGSATFNLDYQTQYYVITNATGYSTRYDYITPSSSTYYLTMQSSGAGILPFWEYFNQYTYACSIDNSSWPASMLINCSVNDSSGHFDTVTLTVLATGYYGSQTLCTNSSSTANFTVSCNLIAPPNQTITYRLTVNTHSDPGLYTIATGIIDWFLGLTAKYGIYGVLMAMIITIGLGLIGIFNPALGIVGAGVGLLLSGPVFGLVNIPTAAMMAILAVCVILVYRIRT